MIELSNAMVVVAGPSENGKKVIAWREICSNWGTLSMQCIVINTRPKARFARHVRHFECVCGP